MAFVALVTLLALALYGGLTFRVGQQRGRARIMAPATSGDAAFERAFRIQQNTAEQLLLFLPSLWIAGLYGSWGWAAALGLVWIAGRGYYAWCYTRDPASRGPGFLVALAAAILLLLIGLIGALSNL